MSPIRLTTLAVVFVSGTCLLAIGCGVAAGGGTAGIGGSAATAGAGGPGSSGTSGTPGDAGTSGGAAGNPGAGGDPAGTGGSPAGAGGSTAGAGAGATGAAGSAAGGRGGTTGGRGGMAGGGTAGAAGAGRGGATGGRGGAAGGSSAGTTGAGGMASGTPTIFYLDVSGKVMTAAAENPTPRTLVASAGQGPDGIAVDLAAGHIFWTGMGNPSADDGFVKRSDLDGSNVVTLVPAGGTYTPKQMRVDPPSGKMYLVGPRRNARHAREHGRFQRRGARDHRLQRDRSDGRKPMVRRHRARHGRRLDVLDAERRRQRRRRLDPARAHPMPAGQTSTNRTDIEILFSGLPKPIDIDLDLEGGIIYWADRGDDTINRAPIAIPSGSTAANRTDRQILVRQVAEAIWRRDRQAPRPPLLHRRERPARARQPGRHQQDGAGQFRRDDRHRRRRPALASYSPTLRAARACERRPPAIRQASADAR